ncbi:hypothetical protein [uncultured Sphingomonas sp.]|uniref:hypothetical protein n=1 Tax=uncultured Sphingomonas sp. TaxID=158754 RepID=UPI0030F6B06F
MIVAISLAIDRKIVGADGRGACVASRCTRAAITLGMAVHHRPRELALNDRTHVDLRGCGHGNERKRLDGGASDMTVAHGAAQ